MIYRYWKIRHPQQGLVIGSPAFADLAFKVWNTADWLATMTVSHESPKAAIAKDEGKTVDLTSDEFLFWKAHTVTLR